ncbi:hypothetical protein PF002_g22255 [Phytophthora fragariae]|uniref:Uncharacterized protein n=1 Tax=Phytophthora fragariae TaxID=53985 RepID=A0A6A3XK08_9STRA|nr:hypothetical protein PF011_g19880 [Phytophthora fragariae]KAE9199071.1 hypothetical protein PF002_g22255 [Phytophthora fragariae]
MAACYALGRLFSDPQLGTSSAETKREAVKVHAPAAMRCALSSLAGHASSLVSRDAPQGRLRHEPHTCTNSCTASVVAGPASEQHPSLRSVRMVRLRCQRAPQIGSVLLSCNLRCKLPRRRQFSRWLLTAPQATERRAASMSGAGIACCIAWS